MKQSSRRFIPWLMLMVFWLAGCAGKAPIDAKELKKLGAELAQASQAYLRELAPSHFLAAQIAYGTAERAYSQGNRSAARSAFTEATKQLAGARQAANIARETFPDVIRARIAARTAGAPELMGDEFVRVDLQFLSLTHALEAGDLAWVNDNKAKVQEGFERLETRAIVLQSLEEARHLLSGAENLGADESHPQILERARREMASAEQFAEENPHDLPGAKKRAVVALETARRVFQAASSTAALQARVGNVTQPAPAVPPKKGIDVRWWIPAAGLGGLLFGFIAGFLLGHGRRRRDEKPKLRALVQQVA